MVRRRHSPDEIIGKLMVADRLAASGMGVAAVCSELKISEATYHRWRTQFGGLKAEDAKRLRLLEAEVQTLRRELRTLELRALALRELVQGKF